MEKEYMLTWAQLKDMKPKFSTGHYHYICWVPVHDDVLLCCNGYGEWYVIGNFIARFIKASFLFLSLQQQSTAEDQKFMLQSSFTQQVLSFMSFKEQLYKWVSSLHQIFIIVDGGKLLKWISSSFLISTLSWVSHFDILMHVRKENQQWTVIDEVSGYNSKSF